MLVTRSQKSEVRSAIGRIRRGESQRSQVSEGRSRSKPEAFIRNPLILPSFRKKRNRRNYPWRFRSGAAIGGATGGLVGGLIGLGIPEIEAKRYEEKLKSGNYLIAVHTRDDDEEDRAKEIFKSAGAQDITTSSMSSAPKKETARV